MCLCVNENVHLCDYEARFTCCLFISNLMPNTHTPAHKPLNYVLDDLPPSPTACPCLGQELCREGGRQVKGAMTAGIEERK